MSSKKSQTKSSSDQSFPVEIPETIGGRSADTRRLTEDFRIDQPARIAETIEENRRLVSELSEALTMAQEAARCLNQADAILSSITLRREKVS